MDVKTILENENHHVNMKLLNYDFEINAERNIYNAIRKKYKALAIKSREKFLGMNAQFTDIDDLLDNTPNAFIVSIEDTLIELIQDIISVNIYSLDKDAIIKLAFNGTYFDEFNESYNKIYSKYDDIMKELAGESYAREQRRRNRPRWQSTTIGGSAINAWSNQLDAAAMNAAEGAAHAVFNMIGNAISTANAKEKLSKLFENKSLRSNLIDSVYDSCFNLHVLLIDILKKAEIYEFNGIVEKGDIEKARAMFNNFTTVKIDEDKKGIFINNIFTLNPYEKIFYKEFFKIFGDRDKSLGNFADFFGMDSIEIKNKILSEFVNENIGETEEDAYGCKDKIEAYAKELGLDNSQISYSYEIINERLEKLDLIYRTVDDIVFDTREIADIAKKELDEIQKIMSTVKAPTKDSMISYEVDLKQKYETISAFTTDIKIKYLKKIQKYLDEFDKKFRSVSFISNGVSREQAGQEKLFQYVQTLPVSDYQQLEKAKELLKEYLPEVGITIEQASKSIEYLDSCEKKLNTVDGVEFKTREEAEYARKELSEISEIMAGISSPNYNSLLPYENYLYETLEKLKKFETQIKEKYINKINKYLVDFDNQFKRVGITKCETREQAADERALAYVRSLTIKSYEELELAKKELLEFLPNVGIQYEQATKAIDYLNKRYTELNTVDGIIFQSKEEADFGRIELNAIMNIMNEVQPPKPNSLLSYERNLLYIKDKLMQYKTPIKNKYISTIDKYLIKFDEQFKQIGLLKKAETREEAAKYKALKLVKSIAGINCTYGDIDKAFEELKNILPEIGIDIEQAKNAVNYLNDQENRVNTVDGVVLSSREDAKLANDELSKIQIIMKEVTPPESEPYLSYERKLLNCRNEIEKFVTPVKNKYLSIIQKYLNEFDEKFRRISLIKVAATRQEAAKERALRFVKSKTYNNSCDIDNTRKELLNDLLPELGITAEQSREALDYLVTIDKKSKGEVTGTKIGGFMNKFRKK